MTATNGAAALDEADLRYGLDALRSYSERQHAAVQRRVTAAEQAVAREDYETARRELAAGLAAASWSSTGVPLQEGKIEDLEDAPRELSHRPPPFPIDCLPAPVSEYVKELARATQTPTDLPGMLVLAVLAATIGGKARVSIRTGWIETLNLYVAVALPPANRKSEVFRRLSEPLQAHEFREREERAPARERKNQQWEIAKRRLDRANKHAADQEKPEAIHKAEAEAMEAAVREADLRPEPEYRLLVDDVTVERLSELMAEQHGRLALLSPEGGIFNTLAGRYSQNGRGSFDVLLKAHGGESIIVDRKTSSGHRVDRPALTIGLAIQPHVLREVGDREFRGRGLTARFLYAVPPSTVGERLIAAEPLQDVVQARWRALLDRLLALPLAEPDVDGDDRHCLFFEAEADAKLQEFERRLEPLMAEGAVLGHIGDWAGKLSGAVARISGLLHLAEFGPSGITQSISAETVARACRLGDYLVEHALVAFDEMRADPTLLLARRAWAAIHRRGVSEVSERNISQWLKGGRPERDELRAATKLLVEYGLLRPILRRKATGPGRPPSPHYAVRPANGPQNPRSGSSCSSSYLGNESQNPQNGRSEDLEDENLGVHAEPLSFPDGGGPS